MTKTPYCLICKQDARAMQYMYKQLYAESCVGVTITNQKVDGFLLSKQLTEGMYADVGTVLEY